MTLNTASGIVSGTPSTITATTNYTVTATNSGGATTVALAITVNDVAPATLTYSTNPATYTKGTAIANNTPTNSGGVILSYSVSPGLPTGLTLNSASGIVSGTPSGITAATNYTVTATNTGGTTTVALTLTINDVIPSSLTYSANPATYTKGTSIPNNTPSNAGGVVLSYSVSPTLPTGLTLNATSGIVSGTPSVISAAANYTVTATNSGGATTTALTITINDVIPSSLTYSTNPATYTKGTCDS